VLEALTTVKYSATCLPAVATHQLSWVYHWLNLVLQSARVLINQAQHGQYDWMGMELFCVISGRPNATM